MDLVLSRGKATYVRGAVAGVAATYAILYALGYAPLWFGPERSKWSRPLAEDEDAVRELEGLDAQQGFRRFRPLSSSRNFLQVVSSTPERRIVKVVFVNRSAGILAGVVRFGPDVEGPPRSVHGGCSAAVADACLGILAHHVSLLQCLTANLHVNYRRKIPLGSAVGVVCHLVRKEGRKIHLAFRFFRLSRGSMAQVGAPLLDAAGAGSGTGELGGLDELEMQELAFDEEDGFLSAAHSSESDLSGGPRAGQRGTFVEGTALFVQVGTGLLPSSIS